MWVIIILIEGFIEESVMSKCVVGVIVCSGLGLKNFKEFVVGDDFLVFWEFVIVNVVGLFFCFIIERLYVIVFGIFRLRICLWILFVGKKIGIFFCFGWVIFGLGELFFVLVNFLKYFLVWVCWFIIFGVFIDFFFDSWFNFCCFVIFWSFIYCV